VSALTSVDIFPKDRPFRLPPLQPSRSERQAVTRALLTGELRQLFRGVFVPTQLELTVDVRCAAVSLVLPSGAAIARRTAAWLFGVDGRQPGEQDAPVALECVVPAGTEPLSRPGVRCYATPLDAADVGEIGGVPCTTPLRTCLDLLRWLRPHMGLGCADALAHRGLVSCEEVLVACERFAGGRGIAQARRLAGYLEPLTESFGESWTRLRMLDAGFPRPTAQIPVVGDDGRVVFRLDLGWPDRLLAAEYDGMEFHASAERQRHDARRREQLATRFGWTAIGVTGADVLGRSMQLERGFGELLGVEPAIGRRIW
jgi:hypothetical protein